MGSILSCYPQPVAYRVTDPRTGLPGRCQWLPTVAEVKAACEAEMPRPTRAGAARPHDVATHDRKAALERIRAEWPELLATGVRKPTHELTIPDYTGKPVFIDAKLMDTQHMRGDREATA